MAKKKKHAKQDKPRYGLAFDDGERKVATLAMTAANAELALRGLPKLKDNLEPGTVKNELMTWLSGQRVDVALHRSGRKLLTIRFDFKDTDVHSQFAFSDAERPPVTYERLKRRAFQALIDAMHAAEGKPA